METDRSGKEKRRAGASGAARAALYKRFRKCEQAAILVNRGTAIACLPCGGDTAAVESEEAGNEFQ
ncbi:hypothetical protein [Oceanibaculum indicum]|uniref:hypothetical protein n=1 Tax=Oceanibaculum indicum TaxID=526216 RepID=UPI0011C3F806|nr:hypothetical protein [Oceanibaculum indicum]